MCVTIPENPGVVFSSMWDLWVGRNWRKKILISLSFLFFFFSSFQYVYSAQNLKPHLEMKQFSRALSSEMASEMGDGERWHIAEIKDDPKNQQEEDHGLG